MYHLHAMWLEIYHHHQFKKFCHIIWKKRVVFPNTGIINFPYKPIYKSIIKFWLLYGEHLQDFPPSLSKLKWSNHTYFLLKSSEKHKSSNKLRGNRSQSSQLNLPTCTISFDHVTSFNYDDKKARDVALLFDVIWAIICLTVSSMKAWGRG